MLDFILSNEHLQELGVIVENNVKGTATQGVKHVRWDWAEDIVYRRFNDYGDGGLDEAQVNMLESLVRHAIDSLYKRDYKRAMKARSVI